jgi:Immunity protein 10
MTLIRANSVVVADDDPILVLVGFEQVTVDSRRYLMLQRSYEFDEQDIELGMNDVYLKRDDQLWSAYGGILQFASERNRVLIKLGGETAAKLGGDKTRQENEAEKIRRRKTCSQIGTDRSSLRLDDWHPPVMST